MATRHSYKLAHLRRLSPLTWRPWAVTWPCHPFTDVAPPPMQRRPSVRTRPPQGIYDAATNPSPSLSLSLLRYPSLHRPFTHTLSLSLSFSLPVLVFPLLPVLFLHSPLQRRLKYLHGQIERYCAESLDYLWSNTGGKSVGGANGHAGVGVIAGDIP